MTEFRVWAPEAEKVELVLGNGRHAMHSAAGGWWILEVPEVADGTDYAYSLDGGEPLPDPRSPWQPAGVHRPSRWVDHSRFPWTDAGWQARPLSAGVIYELHIGTFTPEGTFESAIERLEELASLGITHVELLPVAEFSGKRGWGYDGVNLWAPHSAYGGPEGLKRLVNACHAKGLAVILDVVYNHLGPEGNYLPVFGPYFNERHHTAWGNAINLDDAGSDEVRRFLIENALMWLRDYHFDGLRLDAVHALIDSSALHFLEELAAAVDTLEAGLGRHLVLIAESDLNDPRVIRSAEMGGYGIDAQWSDDFHHALHVTLTGESSGYYADFKPFSSLAHALTQVFVYNGAYSPSRQRRHGRSAAGINASHFLGYLQNHDQIGNRALGERISHLVSPGLAKVGAALVLMAPFVPMLFQGEEWGASAPFLYFIDHEDTALRDAVREGRRKEFAAFGWSPGEVPDPGDMATFERSKLDWSERAREPHAALLDWHRRLIGLRRQEMRLTDGRMERVSVDFSASAGWLILRRSGIQVVCNLSSEPQQIGADTGGWQILLASEADARVGAGSIELPPESVVILKQTDQAERGPQTG